VLAAAEVAPGGVVLDVSTGTGEAAVSALPIVASGAVVGADISLAMLESARGRLDNRSFWPVAADGQALPFKNGSFDAVICQLGLQFYPDPGLGLKEFRRVLRPGGCAAACVVSTRIGTDLRHCRRCAQPLSAGAEVDPPSSFALADRNRQTFACRSGLQTSA
jgi:ubiquinone/menaquinone biosynthesis C-methylase UbiE